MAVFNFYLVGPVIDLWVYQMMGSTNILGRSTENHLHLMVSNQLDAERKYLASLVEMRKDAVKVVPVFADAYKKMSEHELGQRWPVIETLRWKDHPEKCAVDKEVFIRATAIDGLAPEKVILRRWRVLKNLRQALT